jgi:flagellar basal body P-ring formation protein FlgA
MKNSLLLLSIIVALFELATSCYALDKFPIRMIGRARSTVTTSVVQLGDVVDFQAASPQEDNTVIALKRLRLEDSPPPGKELRLTAQDVLNALRQKEVDLAKLGYSLPREIVVLRAGRELKEYELRRIIENHLSVVGDFTELKTLRAIDPAIIFPGKVEFEVQERSSSHLGQMSFSITAVSETGEKVSFDVSTSVDEFREVPVATRALDRGQIIGPSDMAMARLNVDALPKSVLAKPEDIIGLEANRAIGTGDLFHRTHLKVPPLIEKGATIKILYRTKLLEATASAEALEDGIVGQEIRVRSISSRKILKGKVLESGTVQVNS